MQIKAKELLVAVAVKNNGDFNEIIRTIRNKEPISNEEIAKYSHLCQNAVAIIDDNYPKTYKNINMPPLVLFLKDGDHSLLTEASKRGVCVLDDKKTSKINEIVGGILDHGWCYDKDSKIQRARVASIAAGLCGRLFVGYGISALDVSHAVSCTINGEGDVYVVPASIDSKDQLNNALIYEGANVALSWEDIVEHKDDEEKSE